MVGFQFQPPQNSYIKGKVQFKNQNIPGLIKAHFEDLFVYRILVLLIGFSNIAFYWRLCNPDSFRQGKIDPLVEADTFMLSCFNQFAVQRFGDADNEFSAEILLPFRGSGTGIPSSMATAIQPRIASAIISLALQMFHPVLYIQAIPQPGNKSGIFLGFSNNSMV